MREAKIQPEIPLDGLALNVCGDVLQMPPVNNDGIRPRLTCDPMGGSAAVNAACVAASAEDMPDGAREGRLMEAHQ